MNVSIKKISESNNTIPCIGIDGLIHECEPHLNTAICGCVVIKKKVGNYDYEHRYSCYKCTY